MSSFDVCDQTASSDYFEKMNPFPYASAVLHVKQGGLWANAPAPIMGFCMCRAPVRGPEELLKCYGSHLHKFECLYYPCRLTFPTQDAANAHYSQDHDHQTEPVTIRCNQCGDVVESYEDLNTHEHLHLKERNNIYIFFNCDKCNDRYITAQNFIEHLARHKNVTIRHVEIDKTIPSLALPKDIQELRKEQERTFSNHASVPYATPTTGSCGSVSTISATWPQPITSAPAAYSPYVDVPNLPNMEIGFDGNFSIKLEPSAMNNDNNTDLMNGGTEREREEESDCGESEKKKGKRIKKLPGEKRKPELKLFLCVECGRLMSRKSAVATHEGGLDIKCKKVYPPDHPYGSKVKKFEDNDVGVAKDFFDKLNENKGSPGKWAKVVEEINNHLRVI